jgi:hypothetical protein
MSDRKQYILKAKNNTVAKILDELNIIYDIIPFSNNEWYVIYCSDEHYDILFKLGYKMTLDEDNISLC